MSDINITVGKDYPLSGVITNFEAYMFITVQKFIIDHHKIEGFQQFKITYKKL